MTEAANLKLILNSISRCTLKTFSNLNFLMEKMENRTKKTHFAPIKRIFKVMKVVLSEEEFLSIKVEAEKLLLYKNCYNEVLMKSLLSRVAKR